MGHCDRCDAYEADVMAGTPADDVSPCDDYAMTDAFRDWLVNQMRAEVAAQVSRSGLDRMAMVGQKKD